MSSPADKVGGIPPAFLGVREDLFHLREQGERPFGGFGLHFIGDDGLQSAVLFDLTRLVPDIDAFVFKIDVAPHKPHRFTAAQSVIGGENAGI